MTHQYQTQQLFQSFQHASKALFEVTTQRESIFEQGLYIVANAKATNRMKATLAIDREMLLLVSTFPDQQQRTIKFAKQLIDQSLGRLEPALCIVVHLDREGNTKLKNWGRDQNISILPVNGRELRSEGFSLQRSLSTELFSHDPFDVTGPVSDDSNFFGRRDEAIDWARKLQRSQIRTCLGIRKIGKTSIISRVLNETQQSYDALCVMIDGSRDDVWSLTASQLLDSIAATIHEATTRNETYASLSPRTNCEDISLARHKFEKAIDQSPRIVIAVFDEIDYLTPGSPTNPRWKTDFNVFWRNFRVAYQELARKQRPLSLLIAGVSSYWFTVESIDGVENSALSFIPEEYLTPMPRGATIAMLRRLGKQAGLQLDDDAGGAIADICCNMPFWARKAASYVHKHVDTGARPIPLDRSEIEPLLHDFVKEEGAAFAEIALRHLFKVHPELQEVALAISQNATTKTSERHRRLLRRYGVLAENMDVISGKMMTDALLCIESAGAIDNSTSSSTQEVGGIEFGEWAEELAAVGKQRNLLEKKLRDIGVNFIRFDALKSKSIDKVKPRLLAVHEEKHRVVLAHCSAEEIAAKYLWTDLVKLIKREWTLFEQVFGDQQTFLSHCDIVNDRPDAHAKSFDAADFALYRRSLNYLDSRIAKLQ